MRYAATSGDEWMRRDLAHGMSALARAKSLRKPLGPHTVQAAVAACHARAHRFEDTDWAATLALYDALAQLAPSPVIDLNRAVAVLHVDGPQAALAAVDALHGDPRVARGDLLMRLGRHAEAAEELERAAELAPTRHERAMLMERAAAASATWPLRA